ncbi:MAG: hypothetical protein AAF752_16960 [Bacteroidota bacterium]
MHAQVYALILSVLVSLGGVGEEPADNPFSKFFGEWTLKDDTFQQVWDGETVETLTIENHYTNCQAINTDMSVLCVVDAAGLNGHILWTYDSDQERVHHLSHFGTSRNGVGSGTLNGNADLTTRVSFQGEPAGSYRIYEYAWVSEDEYTMMSRQYDESGEPTGNWYGGTFVRVPSTVQP